VPIAMLGTQNTKISRKFLPLNSIMIKKKYIYSYNRAMNKLSLSDLEEEGSFLKEVYFV
jgi:hypothetical protein